jgi:hypothetical protein
MAQFREQISEQTMARIEILAALEILMPLVQQTETDALAMAQTLSAIESTLIAMQEYLHAEDDLQPAVKTRCFRRVNDILCGR